MDPFKSILIDINITTPNPHPSGSGPTVERVVDTEHNIIIDREREYNNDMEDSNRSINKFEEDMNVIEEAGTHQQGEVRDYYTTTNAATMDGIDSKDNNDSIDSIHPPIYSASSVGPLPVATLPVATLHSREKGKKSSTEQSSTGQSSTGQSSAEQPQQLQQPLQPIQPLQPLSCEQVIANKIGEIRQEEKDGRSEAMTAYCFNTITNSLPLVPSLLTAACNPLAHRTQ